MVAAKIVGNLHDWAVIPAGGGTTKIAAANPGTNSQRSSLLRVRPVSEGFCSVVSEDDRDASSTCSAFLRDTKCADTMLYGPPAANLKKLDSL